MVCCFGESGFCNRIEDELEIEEEFFWCARCSSYGEWCADCGDLPDTGLCAVPS